MDDGLGCERRKSDEGMDGMLDGLGSRQATVRWLQSVTSFVVVRVAGMDLRQAG